MQKERRFAVVPLTLAACVFGVIVSCGGGGGGGDTSTAPVARAGQDKTVRAGSQVILDGSGSSNATTYNWSFTLKPAESAAVLSSLIVSKPTFTADKAGSYMLSLLVSNGSVTSSSPDTVTITAINPAPIPDTGQSLCYEAAGQVTLCAGSGQDADYNVISQPSYSDHGDETITDNVTGLMWQKCTLGKSGTNCASGTSGAYNWYTASGTTDVISNPSGTDACGDLILAGHSDWRLPTEFELMTLVDYSGSFVNAINPTYFPDAQPARYWSSTTKADLWDDTSAWYVHFSSGSVTSSLKTAVGRVRCVRGAPSAPVFTDNGDGTVTDLAAGLMWQKQDDGTEQSWTNAMAYCSGLSGPSVGGHDDWRLPNVKELRSIVDTAKWTPAINETYFPSTRPYPYWSSTTYASITNQAWTIGFNNGGTGQSTKGSATTYVRCVRGQ